ncbi:MAG: NAD-dependent epimerase/dehydratase family protein [Actinomycetia bacterium]|nr:NAD-dependent epimerase/dehydratase family protein [Actinomycetes bacterium]
MTEPSSAFLTGGSGLVGGHLLARLTASGTSVSALVRSQSAQRKVTEYGAEPVRGDLFDVDGLARAMRGASVVFHVAGVNDTCPRDVAAMDRVNIEGTRSVIAAAASAGVERVVYTSSAAAIGEHRGTIGTEVTVHCGEYPSPYARSKHLAEIAAFDEAAGQGIDLVALNPSSVQGPGRSSGSAEILLRVLNAKRPILIDTNLSIVDIEDCTTGHIRAAAHGVAGERYLLSGASVSVADAVAVASSIVGREVTPRWASERVVRVLGIPAARALSRVRPSSGICPALVRTLLHGHTFDGAKAERDLGLVYHPIEDTFRRTIDWFLAEGLLEAR